MWYNKNRGKSNNMNTLTIVRTTLKSLDSSVKTLQFIQRIYQKSAWVISEEDVLVCTNALLWANRTRVALDDLGSVPQKWAYRTALKAAQDMWLDAEPTTDIAMLIGLFASLHSIIESWLAPETLELMESYNS